VPDALAEALDEDYDAVYEASGLLAKGRISEAERLYGTLAHEILADAVEGSTYFGAASSESEQKQAAIFRAGQSLARKIGQYIGRALKFPDY